MRKFYLRLALGLVALGLVAATAVAVAQWPPQPPPVTITVINSTNLGGYITYWPDQCNKANVWDGAGPQTYIMPWWVKGMSFLANGRTERAGIWPGCTVTFMVAPNGDVVASVQ